MDRERMRERDKETEREKWVLLICLCACHYEKLIALKYFPLRKKPLVENSNHSDGSLAYTLAFSSA